MPQQAGRTPRARGSAVTVVVFACAASAGIHAGIVPEHLREEPRLGVAFIVVAFVLLATSAAVSFRPSARPVASIAAVGLGGPILGYLASRTTGIPLLAPDPEPVDAIGLVAVCIELGGVICALWLTQPIGRLPGRALLEEVTE